MFWHRSVIAEFCLPDDCFMLEVLDDLRFFQSSAIHIKDILYFWLADPFLRGQRDAPVR